MNGIISQRTRTSFRDLTTNSTLREIRAAFEDQGFAPRPDPTFEDSSQRRTLTNEYFGSVDWNSASHCERVIKVMEDLVAPMAPDQNGGHTLPVWSKFVRSLKDDGWMVQSDGTFSPLIARDRLTQIRIENINDASAIQEHIDRLRRSQNDPAAVIGVSKELIESTAKVVLHELGISLDTKLEFPKLIKMVQVELGLDAASTGIDSESSIKRILGGAANIANGLNELRNAGYGTGHGQVTARVGLAARHARLAVNAAALWCELVLETYSDPHAPWHTRRSNAD
ncbi:abortive infection family protein [Arcanobacterium canis]